MIRYHRYRRKLCQFGHRITTRHGVRRCYTCKGLYGRLYREDERRERGATLLRYGDTGKCRNGHDIDGHHYVVRAIDRRSGTKRICAICTFLKNHARRVKTRGLFVEVVDPIELYRRHGGICGICNHPVHVNQFQVDHVIPLARGGNHSYANTQPAHPACNLKKGAKMPALAA